MDWNLFASTFALIFMAEFPDKTAFATLVMASRGKPLAVFLGAALAFVVQSLVAVSFGRVIGLLPSRPVHIGAGITFLLFAILMWRKRDGKSGESEFAKKELGAGFFRVATTAFVVIFLAEWGDLTQLATATLVARTGEPLTVFSAATLGLWAATGISVLIGHGVKHFLNPVLMQKVAAIAFAVVGVTLLIGLGD